jgi:hypothetical protein
MGRGAVFCLARSGMLAYVFTAARADELPHLPLDECQRAWTLGWSRQAGMVAM